MQFSLIPLEGGRFQFQVQDDNNQAILDSPEFRNRESCIASIRGFIDQMRDPNAANIVNEDNSFYFQLKDEIGEVWMNSLVFGDREQVENLLQRLQEKASDNTSFEVSMRQQKKDTSRKSPLSREINYEDLYDFSLSSRSKKLGFHPVQSSKDKRYYALFNNDAGSPILFSRSFSSPAQRDKRIRSIIKQADKAHKYELLEKGGGTFFILKGSNGKEIARSAIFPDRASAELAQNLLQTKAPGFAAKFPEPPKAPKKQVNVYRLDQASASGKTGFEPLRSSEGLHYFHFNDEQGQALLYSEGYKAKKSRDNGIRSLIKNAGLENRYEVKQDSETYHFTVRAGNRQEIARSRNFTDEKSLLASIEWLKIQIPRYAAEYGVSLDTEFLTENFLIEVDKQEEEADGSLPIQVTEAETSPTEFPEDDSEIGGEATHAQTNPTGFWGRLWPWLLLVLLLLLLLLLFRNCQGDTAAISTAKEEVQAEISPADSPDPNRLEGETSTSNAVASGDDALDEAKNTDTNTSNESADEKSPSLSSEEGNAANTNTVSTLGFAAGTMLAKMEVFLKGPETGNSPIYQMDHARFPFNSPKLNKEAEKELDELTKLLTAYPEANLEIYGHIDLNEEDYYSGPFSEEFLTLSAIRARCIYRKLIERGISEDRLSFKGFANQKPLEKKVNDINRRLELVLIK